MTAKSILGIHHVTAIAGEPQRNADFYAGVLGLRLVKRTVNFDSPTTYHLYYGNGPGEPGSLLTFFPWPGLPPGRRGTGQVTAVAFTVPPGSLDWWEERLEASGARLRGRFRRWGEPGLAFDDPDGLRLELVEQEDDREGWAEVVPGDRTVGGIHGVTLTEEGYEGTAELLGTLGFGGGGEEDGRHRFAVGDGPGRRVEVACEPTAPDGRVAVGTVHHVAFRTPDGDAQRRWRGELADRGYNVTPILDRHYFRSIYFREPGGVLFEIATDPPGFTVDEPVDRLGSGLRLPPWLEGRRREVEAGLPPLDVPAGTGG